jgi:WD40 repeat protein
LEVAEEICRAASARLPENVQDFSPALRDALTDRADGRFGVVIDALDEAADVNQGRAIMSEIIPSLADFSNLGVRVVVGSRRFDDKGDIVANFPGSLHIIDLDSDTYFSYPDLVAYAFVTLRQAGAERLDSPYAVEEFARDMADRIARFSGRNFLIAGLIARSVGLQDIDPVASRALTLPPTVSAAMHRYLQTAAPVGRVEAETVITPLAFVEDPGVPFELWEIALEALGAEKLPTTRELEQFTRGPGANFLVESRSRNSISVFRLFHRALTDALLESRARVATVEQDERALARSFISHGRKMGWGQAPVYLLRSLAFHAARAGIIDDLLCDDSFLLYADIDRLLPFVEGATSSDGQGRVRLLRLTPDALAAEPETRVALFSVTESLESLGRSFFASALAAPYRARWASTRPRAELAVLEGHTGPIGSGCAFTQDGRVFLASSAADETVRVWDPATGTCKVIIRGHAAPVRALCAFTWTDGRTLLASGGDDGTVRTWDPATGTPQAVLEGHMGWIRGICAFAVDGQTLLATGAADETVRVWDPATGTCKAVIRGHIGSVRAIAAFSMDGQTFLVSGGDDGTARIWDPATGRQQAVMDGHTGWVRAVCAFAMDGRTLLASGADDGTVRIWDPTTGTQQAILHGHAGWVNSLCELSMGGRILLASGAADGTVRIWDPASGTQLAILTGNASWVTAVFEYSQGSHVLLATCGADQTVRIWDPATYNKATTTSGRADWINALCQFSAVEGWVIVGGESDGTVRTWDPATGTQQAVLDGHTGPVRALSALTLGTQRLIASAADDETVRIWDPATGACKVIIRGHVGPVRALCALTGADGQELVASGGDDATVRTWDPATGTQQAVLDGHTGPVRALSALTLGTQRLIASAAEDRTVRIWDWDSSRNLLELPIHYPAQTTMIVDRTLIVGMASGLIALTLSI